MESSLCNVLIFFCDFIAEMSVNETEEVVGADNRVAFSIEGIALLHVGILGKDFWILGQNSSEIALIYNHMLMKNQNLVLNQMSGVPANYGLSLLFFLQFACNDKIPNI